MGKLQPPSKRARRSNKTITPSPLALVLRVIGRRTLLMSNEMKAPSPLAPLPKGEGNPFPPLSLWERGWG